MVVGSEKIPIKTQRNYNKLKKKCTNVTKMCSCLCFSDCFNSKITRNLYILHFNKLV